MLVEAGEQSQPGRCSSVISPVVRADTENVAARAACRN